MIARYARRGLEALVALFALLGFCFVPLGQKTAFEHFAAIAKTGPASELARELVEAGQKLRRKLFQEIDREAPAKERSTPSLVAASPADAGAPDASVDYRSASR